jgi:hypothetical protein
MLIAVLRGAWTAILPRRRRKVPQDFAPTAQRPAPAEPTTSEAVRAITRSSSDATVVVPA